MKSSVFFLSASIVIIIFSSCSIFPQSADDTLSGHPEKLHTFNIYLINGYALSYEFSKCNQSLYRVQLDYSSGYTEDETDGENISTNSSGIINSPRSETYNRSSISVSLSAHYIYSFLKTNSGEAYIGAGPAFGFSRSMTENGYTDTSLDSTVFRNSTNSTDKSYSLGIIFILGIKAYLTKNLSVFAEANISGGKKWTENNYVSSSITDYPGSTDYSYSNTSNLSGGGWFYDARYARLGISLSI